MVFQIVSFDVLNKLVVFWTNAPTVLITDDFISLEIRYLSNAAWNLAYQRADFQASITAETVIVYNKIHL